MYTNIDSVGYYKILKDIIWYVKKPKDTVYLGAHYFSRQGERREREPPRIAVLRRVGTGTVSWS